MYNMLNIINHILSFVNTLFAFIYNTVMCMSDNEVSHGKI